MTFLQLLKDMLKRGNEPRYVVKSPGRPKPPLSKTFKLRGIGYTRPDKKRSKKCRSMAKASRHRNRRKRKGAK